MLDFSFSWETCIEGFAADEKSIWVVSVPDLWNKISTQAVVTVKARNIGLSNFYAPTTGNEHGFDYEEINLTVVDPPRLTSKPELVSKSNQSLTIKWKVWEYSEDEGGLPTDRVDYLVIYKESGTPDWIKLGTWKGSSVGSSDPMVIIENLNPNTLYDISVKCRRMKEGGTGDPGPVLQAKTECGVAMADGIPQEFLPERITQTSVTLTWKNPPEALLQCPLVSYQVTYHPEAFESIMDTVDTDGIQTSITLEDLTPNTNYVVKLYPVTGLEQSKFFAELIMRTSETIPGAVSNLEINVVEDKPDLLLVSWEAPSEEFGTIKGYIVTTILVDRGQCGLVGEPEESRIRQIHSDDTEITLQNLYPYSTYNISVQARTSAGEGEAVFKDATTLESVPSEAPTNVRVISFTNDTLEFEWNPINCKDANGDIIYYDYAIIHYEDVPTTAIRRRKSLKNISHIFYSVPDYRVKIDDLKPFTSYGFMVAGVTGVGRGPLSDTVFHKTDEGIPSEPVSLSIISVADRKMKVSWGNPEFPNGNVTQYRIRAWINESSEADVEVHQKAIKADKQYATIEGLKPATLYIITVEAATKAGWGNYTQLLENTLDGVPGEPSEVSVLENQQKSLNISWKAPLQSNGVIVGYKVNYRPISTLDPVFNTTPFIEKEVELKANDNDIMLNNLHPSTQYKVLVSAKTSAGYGMPASILCWTVISGDHVSPSLKVIQVDATNDSIPIVFSTTGSSAVHNVSQTGEQGFVSRQAEVGRIQERPFKPGHQYKIRIRTLVVKDEELKSVLSKPVNKSAEKERNQLIPFSTKAGLSYVTWSVMYKKHQLQYKILDESPVPGF
ncbi:collagen alpha-1(XII) chain [Nephila pilipes]|uniref:Collagen alpha-1(XII) chain n=1 Tax=Nephila pilipes TaxID=299642 RepID=A0A8X6QB93_NEPPI|nr:collagen alpha-1(XII) chain [Nephila pilipes]